MHKLFRTLALFSSGSLLAACGFTEHVLTPDPPSDASQAPGTNGEAGNAANNDAGQLGPGPDHGGHDGGALPDGGAVTRDGGIGGTIQAVAKDADCDFNGIWIGRQNTLNRALFNAPQYANNWYYLELRQDGEDLVVVDHFDCGIHVIGTVIVQLTPTTAKALMLHNKQAGRKGTVKKQSDGTCAVDIERFWSVRGVSESKYIPSPRSRVVTSAQLASENPLPTDAAQSEDWDHDGKPGVAWQVSGIASGTRDSAQRDWTHYFTAPNYTVPANTDWTQDLVIRSEFGSEEVVYDATNQTLYQLATPDGSAEHALTLRFLGRTKDDARAKALLTSDDFQTCLAIQSALPAIEGLK